MSGTERKWALVTGASAGIGKDLATVLAENGHDLVLVARREAQLNELAKQLEDRFSIRTHVLPSDLSLPDAADQLVSRMEQQGIEIHTLVNNAGFGGHGAFIDTEAQRNLQMIQVNIVALTHLTRLLLPGMIARGEGRVLNVGSTGAFTPAPLMAVYCATKAYVLSFSEALANEVAGTGVTVTCLCPGPTSTEFAGRAGADGSRAFTNGVSDSMVVARAAWAGMSRGKPVVVPELRNKLLTVSARLAPRGLAASITRRILERAS
jgi:short-subunit dehydrogenase